jgi:hypothetical protein
VIPTGWRFALPLAAVIAAGVVVTMIEGAPARLPGVALGSTVLLHVERAAALFAIVVAVLSVLAQATRGRLPTQLSTGGLAYEAEAAADTQAAVGSPASDRPAAGRTRACRRFDPRR